MAHTIKALAISIGAALALTSLPSHAEITLLKQDPQAGDPLSRLNFNRRRQYPAAVQHDDRRWRQRLL